MNRRLAIAIAGYTLFFPGLILVNCAEAQLRLIKVDGSGVEEVTPDAIQFNFNIAGNGPNATKALADFRSNRQRIEDTLNPMDFPRTTLAFSGKQLHAGASNQVQRMQMQMMMFQGQMDQENMEMVSVTEDFQLRLQLGDEGVSDEVFANISKIVDIAMEAKATPALGTNEPFYEQGGSNASAVRAILDDPASAQKAAVSKAFEDARKKANDLAALAGAKLGSVHSIAQSEAEIGTISPWTELASGKGSTSILGQKLRVSTVLSVEFELLSDN